MSKDLEKFLGKTARDFTVTSASVDVEKREIELSFSSEEPYERWPGEFEVLSHTKGAMRTQRLASGHAPLLLNHCRDWQIGVITELVQSEGRGRCRVRFSKKDFANDVFQDVLDGIATNVSVGYLVHNLTLAEKTDSTSTYLVTDWEPFEVSIVSIPADPTVGVGRSAEIGTDPSPRRSINIQKEMNMKDVNAAASGEQTPVAETKEVTTNATPDNASRAIDVDAASERAVKQERRRVQALRACAALHPDHGGKELAEKMIAEGGSEEEWRQVIAERAMKSGNAPTRTDTPVSVGIGMSQRDLQKFSLLRLIRAQAALPGSTEQTRAVQAAGFELECCNEAARSMPTGYQVRGVVVPFDVLSRGFTVGNPAAAGSLVDNTLMIGDFITALRNRMVLASLGVRYLPGLVGNATIPRQLTIAGVTWLNENEAAPESEFTVDGLTLTPKTISSRTQLSRSFLQQTAPSVEALIIDDFTKSLAAGIDTAALFGTGAANKQPLGVVNQPGIAVVEIGANGGPLSWKKVVELETVVASANADAGNLAYVTNAKVRGVLKSIPKEAGQATYIWREDNTVNGYKATATNAVPSNGNKGNGTGLSTMLFGDFSQLTVASWGGLDIHVDPYTKSDIGAVRVTLFQSVDIGCRHAEGFSVCTDINTTVSA